MSDATTASMETSSVRLAVQGLWLPVGRTIFFDFQQDHDLIKHCNAYDKDAAAELTGYTIPREEMGGKRLSASVYHRLVSVLSSGLRTSPSAEKAPNRKRYSRAYPMYNVWDREQFNRNADPDTIALVCAQNDIEGPEWVGIKDRVHGIVLMVVSEGLYVWLVPYTASSEASEQAARESAVQRALSEHIQDLVGGDFFSHSSGRPRTLPYVADPDAHTLKDYRDMDLGFLTYSQINMVLEGLYNAMLDPRVFFDDSEDGSKGDAAKREYSLGNFAELIRTNVEIDPEQRPLPDGRDRLAVATQALLTLLSLHDDDHQDAPYYFTLFKSLRDACLNVWVRRDIVRQFMRRTSTDTLNLNVYRVESCGRALLGTMIGVAHLHRPLVQVDVPAPRADIKRLSPRYVIPDGATEGQLRGYILLLAAKFSLVESTYHYLDNTIRRLRELVADEYSGTVAEDLDKRYVWRSIAGVNSAREALLASLRDSIKGLESALEQAHMDGMLRETEKIRTEEETLTEIERIRARADGTSAASASFTSSVISNALALFALVATVIVGIKSGAIMFPQHWADFVSDISNIPIIVVVGFGLIMAYFGLQFAVDALLFRPLVMRRLRRRSGEEQYFYEMDVRLDAPVSHGQAEAILAGDFQKRVNITDWGAATEKGRRALPRVARGGWWRWKRSPFRSSYRVSRTADDDASHKVYVVASVTWPRKWLFLPWFARKRVRLVLMYEVVYHTPVEVDRYELRNLRIVAAAKHVLDPGELRQFAVVAVQEFINRWIADEQHILTEKDAVFSLVRMEPTSPNLPASRTAVHGPEVARH